MPTIPSARCSFLGHEVTNTSTVDYTNVVFGMLVGTYVGVTGTDDRPRNTMTTGLFLMFKMILPIRAITVIMLIVIHDGLEMLEWLDMLSWKVQVIAMMESITMVTTISSQMPPHHCLRKQF